MHREIIKIPDGFVGDHINRNTLDNQRKNLRAVLHFVNVHNTTGGRKNKNGFRGIYFCKRSSRWWARIYVNKKAVWLGTHGSADEAAKAYDKAAYKYFGPTVFQNFPRAEKEAQ
jgi:hypothetical protein